MKNPKDYYLTTAITYTSGKPHIGNTYEIILADAIARSKRQEGYNVYFQTGTDEHGQKIELKAQEAGIPPKQFVDEKAAVVKNIWDLMDSSYDKFMRTTDEYHIKQVQKIFKKLYDQGDIYLGIVGPVRSGKSTFIKRFMEMAVIPYIEDPDVKIRTIDELPQSGKGKMIMTVEPKFIPNQAVKIDLQDDFKINVRLVDCVGYVIEGASGYQDDSGIRLVKTPWYNESIPFDQAAKIGTKKVIQDHSTIGIVVTSDGSFLDIDEQSYHSATKEIIQELQDIGKPFIVIVNSKDPSSSKCQNVVESYQKEYDVPIIAIDTTNMLETQIVHLLQEALNEFGIHEVKIEVPRYIAMLNQKHWLKQTLDEALKNSLVEIKKIKDVKHLTEGIESYDFVKRAYLKSVDTSHSSATIRIEERNGLYDELLTNIVGYEVDRSSILALLQELMTIKDEYDGISNALSMVRQTGYGYAIPRLEEIELSKPEIIKQGSRYGMKLKSKAATTYMIKIDIESTFEPIIGSKQQAESFIDYLNHNGNDKEAIFSCDVFGRKLGDLIEEGMYYKLNMIPENASLKIHDILSKIVNKGKSNVIAIVL